MLQRQHGRRVIERVIADAGAGLANAWRRREGEVLAQLLTGASNKEVARQLGISPRTIEIHRAHIMGKLGAKNAADLVRIVMSERRGS